MQLSSDAVLWMFMAVVLISAIAMITNYAIVKSVITGGRAMLFDRQNDRHLDEDYRSVATVPFTERSRR